MVINLESFFGTLVEVTLVVVIIAAILSMIGFVVMMFNILKKR